MIVRGAKLQMETIVGITSNRTLNVVMANVIVRDAMLTTDIQRHHLVTELRDVGSWYQMDVTHLMTFHPFLGMSDCMIDHHLEKGLDRRTHGDVMEADTGESDSEHWMGP